MTLSIPEKVVRRKASPRKQKSPKKGKVLKKHPAGVVFLRKGSNKLWVRIGRKVEATGLDNTKNGMILAQLQLDDLWRKSKAITPIRNHQPVDVQKAFALFIEDRIKAGRFPKTIDNYTDGFRAVVGDRKYILSYDAVMKDVERLRGRRDIGNNSKNIYLDELHVFLEWCTEPSHHHIDTMPSRKAWNKTVKAKVPPKRILIFTDDELNRIFDWFNRVDIEFSLLLQFLYAGGFRIGEAISMSWSQINSDTIAVLSKLKDRWCYPPRTAELDGILHELRQFGEDRSQLFRWKTTSISTLRHKLDAALKELKIDKDGRAFHTFRKSRWSDLAKHEVDKAKAAQIMRCSYKIAEEHYVVFSTSDLREAAEKKKA